MLHLRFLHILDYFITRHDKEVGTIDNAVERRPNFVAQRCSQLLGEIMLHFYLLVMQVFGDIIDYKDLNVSIANGQAFDFNLQKSGFCRHFLCLHT